MLLFVFGYIYMGIIGVYGVLDLMKSGYVDEMWVCEYYEVWFNDVKVGKFGYL